MVIQIIGIKLNLTKKYKIVREKKMKRSKLV